MRDSVVTPVSYERMSGARIIDGKALAAAHRERIGARAGALRKGGRAARLDAVLVADGDNASRVYGENQAKTCAALGIHHRLHELPAGSRYDDIAGRVLLLSSDDDVTGIMVHLPLPSGVDAPRVQSLIAPEKDVEGVNPANIGNIVYGRSSLVPCTALATLKMVESTDVSLKGKTCVVVGASNIVGKPIAVLLMRHEATVVSCNKFTRGIEGLAREADVLIGAAGVPGLITKEWVKPGAIVVDVGATRVEQPDGTMKTVGDVRFDEVRAVAGWVSPVPGGVGPMTVAMLLDNVVTAAEGGRV